MIKRTFGILALCGSLAIMVMAIITPKEYKSIVLTHFAQSNTTEVAKPIEEPQPAAIDSLATESVDSIATQL